MNIRIEFHHRYQEHLGPSQEDEDEFAKELAKLVTDTSMESRKVDKKTALALWDSAVLPPVVRKKRADEEDAEFNGSPEPGTMAFTVITKRGHKQNVGPTVEVLIEVSLCFILLDP